MSTNEKSSWIIKFIWYGLFLCCFGGLLFKVNKCVEKYLDKPEGVAISTSSQTKSAFPAMTFCPLATSKSSTESNVEFSPNTYNWTWLKECGIDENFRKNGQFIGSEEIVDCKNPIKLWEKAATKLADLGIEEVSVRTLKSFPDWHQIPITDKNDTVWKKIQTDLFGFCYSLVIPHELIKEEINVMYLKFSTDKSLYILFHSDGLLNPMNPWLTVDFAYNLVSKKSAAFDVTYIYKSVMDFDGSPCQQKSNYDFTSCMLKYANKEVFKEVGCVTPFEGRNEKVCKEPEKGKKAYQVYQRSMLNTSVCMYPCQYHSTFTINKVEEPDMQPGSLWLGFRNFIQVHKANHIYTSLDLLASVGGYIGLFLGFSLLQIRDVLVLMIKKFL